jgi:hypothetical protein
VLSHCSVEGARNASANAASAASSTNFAS